MKKLSFTIKRLKKQQISRYRSGEDAGQLERMFSNRCEP